LPASDAVSRDKGPILVVARWCLQARREAAHARIAELDHAERPLRIHNEVPSAAVDDLNGIVDHAPLATPVAWVRDLFERIDVDSRVEKTVAVWTAATAPRVLTGRTQ